MHGTVTGNSGLKGLGSLRCVHVYTTTYYAAIRPGPGRWAVGNWHSVDSDPESPLSFFLEISFITPGHSTEEKIPALWPEGRRKAREKFKGRGP